jgi:DNA helicase-2/ATP-dependent DNA helicase PcrA
MLVFCYELLKERKDILAMWQQKFQYILIDEFQDINKVQYEIVLDVAGGISMFGIIGSGIQHSFGTDTVETIRQIPISID